MSSTVLPYGDLSGNRCATASLIAARVLNRQLSPLAEDKPIQESTQQLVRPEAPSRTKKYDAIEHRLRAKPRLNQLLIGVSNLERNEKNDERQGDLPEGQQGHAIALSGVKTRVKASPWARKPSTSLASSSRALPSRGPYTARAGPKRKRTRPRRSELPALMLTPGLIDLIHFAIDVLVLLAGVVAIIVISSAYAREQNRRAAAYLQSVQEHVENLVKNVVTDIETAYEGAIVSHFEQVLSGEGIPDDLAAIGARQAFIDIKTESKRQFTFSPMTKKLLELRKSEK
jgi:hypothetical protein